jgi:hypothetical protein
LGVTQLRRICVELCTASGFFKRGHLAGSRFFTSDFPPENFRDQTERPIFRLLRNRRFSLKMAKWPQF